MHSVAVRLNTVIFFALTVLLVCAVMCAISSYPHKGVPIVSKLKVNKIQSLRHHGGVDRALLSFDMTADFEPAFHWNSKQFFVYIVAEYESVSHKLNQVVVWDKILTRGAGKLRINNELVKYSLADNGSDLRNKTVVFKLAWDHMPLTGPMSSGEDKTSPYSYTLPKKYMNN